MDAEELVRRGRANPGHVTKRGVVEDDPGGNVALLGQLSPQIAEMLEKVAVNALL